MNNQIIKTYYRLLSAVPTKTHRYLFYEFNINSKLTGLVGPRGTGKTTLLLQYINENISKKSECIYVSLDNIYFANKKLINFIDECYDIDGIRYFFLDEVHKYENWAQELKNVYDSYPDIKIVFSGSSTMDILKGHYDLSRRVVLFELQGLSFREYIFFKNSKKFSPLGLKNLLENQNEEFTEICSYKKLLGLFKDYLEYGYYPFVFEDRDSYHAKVLNIINKIVYEDIATFYKLKTENLHYFLRILSYISTIPPGELNRNSIAKNIGLDNKTIQNYLEILQKSGLVNLIKENKAGSGILKQTEKIYLNNPNIYKAISLNIGFNYSEGAIREIFFINMIQNAGHTIYYSGVGDFLVNDLFFEVGGKNKSKKQIKDHINSSYLVKDNILYRTKREVPLFLFGFMY